MRTWAAASSCRGLQHQLGRRIQHGRRKSRKAEHQPQANAERVVRIGDVSLQLAAAPASAARWSRIPQKYGFQEAQGAQELPASGWFPQADLKHARWMMQKYALGQDMFLMGAPGPYRRQLAMWFAELAGVEVEYLPLSRDVSDADLKQRREIVGGSLEYADAAPVRAAIHGRLLILDGIEKAERNVLPTLNNLLENREMNLPDGRFLIAPQRYAELVAGKGGGDDSEAAAADLSKLVPVHPDFRVIALGVPVPRFPGFPLGSIRCPLPPPHSPLPHRPRTPT